MSLLDEIEHLRDTIDGFLFSMVIGAYVQARQVHKGEDLYFRMLRQCLPSKSAKSLGKIDNEMVNGLMMSAVSLLTFYRHEIAATLHQSHTPIPESSKQMVHLYTERAETILKQMEAFRDIDHGSFVDGLRISMIDIYTEINDLEKLDMMLLGTEQPSRSFFWGLIKAYRKRQQPERAEGVVRSMIENPHHHNPDIGLINGLISAWADAAGTHPQAAEHAFNVYRWLVDDPDVERLNLQPTVVTYSTLLNCLALSGSSAEDIRQKIAVLVKDMENRFKMGNTSCQPDETFYNLVIKAFLRANSPKEAEAILQRMEQQFESESCDDVTVRPSIRTYSEFLMFYSRLGTVSAAERTTQIHDQLRELSQTIDPSLKPNVYTYNMVLNGWASTNDASTGDHIWKIYEQMVNVDQVELNKYNYTTLLTFYSKSKRLQDVQRAIRLLQAMQNSCDSDMHPQVKHYDMVLWICRNTGALKQAAEVLISFMEAYTSGKCRMDDKKPSSRFYTWVFTNLLQSNDLVGATRFVLDTLAVTKDKKVLSDFGLVPVFVLQLRQEWTDSDNVDKEKYIDQLDSEVLPVLR